MEIFEDIDLPEIPGMEKKDKKPINLAECTVTVRIDCRSCTMKGPDCHRNCPQMTNIVTENGRKVTDELLQKGRRARKHKDISVSFCQFMAKVGEVECGMQNAEFGKVAEKLMKETLK